MALHAWLLRGGGRLAPLVVGRGPSGERGLFAAQALRAESEVAAVPRALLLTTEVARDAPVGRSIGAAGLGALGPQADLAAYLCLERRAVDSPWRAYIDALPAAFPGLPLFFAPDDLALLAGSSLLGRIAVRRRSIEREFTALALRVPALRRAGFEDFLWARLVVISRVFALEVDGLRTEALVPFADLMNHGRPADARWGYERRAGAFCMTSTRAVPAHAELHDSYGKKSNRRLLLNYGFALPDNPSDEGALACALPARDRLQDAKARFLAIGARTFYPSARHGDDEMRRMLSFLRVAHCDERELHAVTHARVRPDSVPALSCRNELAVLDALEEAAERALAGFPTSVATDDALLAGSALSPVARACVWVRRGEKLVLERLSARARAARPFIAAGSKRLAAAAARVEGARGGDVELGRYLVSVASTLATRAGASSRASR